MPEPADKLTPATPEDVASALAFALRFQGRKRLHNADEIMAEIVARRLVEHLERAGFVIMKRAPICGRAARPDSRPWRSPQRLAAGKKARLASYCFRPAAL